MIYQLYFFCKKVKSLRFFASLLLCILTLIEPSCGNGSSTYELNTNKAAIDSLAVVIADSIARTENDKEIHFCTELFPPPPPNFHIKYKTDTHVFYRSKNDNDTIISTTLQPTHAYSAIVTQYRWPENHRNISVSFLDGNPKVHKRIQETVKEWEKYCGIKFNFITGSDADITISFKYIGSWSQIGTHSRNAKPSMNFGWLYEDTEQEEYNRTVLHEFGHALGFIHEHSSPNAHINWNAEKVYRYYMGPPNNWDKPTVDYNIFYKYDKTQCNATEFDPKSIMIYEIPKDFTTDGYFVKSNSKLSELDIQLVSKAYPKTQLK